MNPSTQQMLVRSTLVTVGGDMLPGILAKDEAYNWKNGKAKIAELK